MSNLVASDASPLLRLLRPGIDSPPIFFAPGFNAAAETLQELAERIEASYPVYGLEYKAVTSRSGLYTEETVQALFDAIRRAQPQGPYLLVGYSLGGLLALGTATRLAEQGEKRILLVLIETYPHVKYWPFKEWVRFLMARALLHGRALLSTPITQVPRYIVHRAFLFWRRLHDRAGPTEDRSAADLRGESREVQHIQSVHADYHPTYYGGKVTFVRSQLHASHFPNLPNAIWRQWAKNVEVYTLPGDHLGFMGSGSQIQKLADQIMSSVRTVESG